jgi:hypothetical protein
MDLLKRKGATKKRMKKAKRRYTYLPTAANPTLLN